MRLRRIDKLNEENNLLHNAIAAFGQSKQKAVAIEEMSELQKEICKDLRGIGRRESIIEEFVDVNIMLKQIEIMYDLKSDELIKVYDEKMERLRKTLNADVFKEMGISQSTMDDLDALFNDILEASNGNK